MTTDLPILLAAADVAALLDLPSCITAVERGLCAHDQGRTIGPASLGLALDAGSFHVKAAGLRADDRSLIAAKANVNLPGNPSRTGRPTIQGVLILCDAGDGRPLAIMDSTVLTSRRTGAVAAVAARHLARPGPSIVTIVGCGEQGDVQLRAIAAVRDVHRVFAADVDEAKARAYASRMARDVGVAVDATSDLADAIGKSDICVTCTTSSRAIIRREHLHPGLFVAAMGADNPHKQEIDPLALSSSLVVVDSIDACAAGGDLHHAIAAGVMTPHDVHAELSAIAGGRAPGRTDPDDVFIFDSAGTAVQDVAAAALAYTRALETGRGLLVSLGAG